MATTFGLIFKDNLKADELTPSEKVETVEPKNNEPAEKVEQKSTRKKSDQKE